MSNDSVLKASILQFKKIKYVHLMSRVNEIAWYLLKDAISLTEGWVGFTGNLPTSYAAGVWDFDGNLEILYAGDLDPALNPNTVIREKIKKGETYNTDMPWAGEPRGITGQVSLSTKYGVELSRAFLTSYKPKRLPCIVICTGAEYSVWLEQSREGANVLSASYDPNRLSGELKRFVSTEKGSINI